MGKKEKVQNPETFPRGRLISVYMETADERRVDTTVAQPPSTGVLHAFHSPVTHIPLPERFTYPFCYTPYPLCVLAAEEVQAYLSAKTEWQAELEKGKMFGVLVVRAGEGKLGYVAAFSGMLAGKSIQPFFVPPVCNMQQLDDSFRLEEDAISGINALIESLESSEEYRVLREELAHEEACMKQWQAAAKRKLKTAKAERDRSRSERTLTVEEEEALIRESQFQKAEYKRQELQWKRKLIDLQEKSAGYESRLESLRTERKQRSAALQQRLFSRFRMLNYRGEEKDLCDIFEHTLHKVPPSGAGDCAAPKLLQYAYLHGWKPLAMAEFWWGASPVSEMRRHGHYYPACKGKCEPILKHMLQGLDVEPNPLLPSGNDRERPLDVVYEDEWLVVVNKPAGLLSVPGKGNAFSVYEWACRRYPQTDSPLMVHRLDMDTSGLLVVAKTKEAHCRLQAQFKHRLVRKRYVAWVVGQVGQDRGTIDLPLCPDWLDRPRQMVDWAHGKPAVTDFEVLQRKEGCTLVAFYPHTGRTHQLRVHAAHQAGLHCPIRGDALYGTKADRLYLHAESLTFTHPVTGEKLELTQKADFY